MPLSLSELKEYLITKEGYDISPRASSLDDLKQLLNNMYQVRNQNTCVSHIGTSYEGSLSLGDMYDVGQSLKPCSCNSYKHIVCSCQSRTATSTCVCNDRATGSGFCNCENRTYLSTCTCNVRTNTVCNCQSRTHEPSCTLKERHLEGPPSKACVSDVWCVTNTRAVCSCENRTAGLVDHNSLVLYCNCYTRTAVEACDCNGRTNPDCDCRIRVGQSHCTCNDRTGVCNCEARIYTSTCNCNGRCSCDVEKRFE